MNFYNWNFLKSCFFIGLTVAVLGGIAITILPEQREMISIVIKSALVTGLLPIGLVFGFWGLVGSLIPSPLQRALYVIGVKATPNNDSFDYMKPSDRISDKTAFKFK